MYIKNIGGCVRKAIVISKLVVKFDQAITDAKDKGNLIEYFQLESKAENKLLSIWIRQAGVSFIDNITYEYDGIPVRVFVPSVDIYEQLDINPTMDKHSFDNGLSHWSCVSPKDNEWWVRIDGRKRMVSFSKENGYIDDLRHFDKKYPMETK